MNNTEINWTEHTWNPMSGCTKITAGCKHCYAETLAENKRGTKAFPNGFDLTFRPHKLDEPRRLKRPSLIFTNSMSDFFHADVPDEYRDRICDAIEASPQHRYQVLTKRPENAARYAKRRRLPRSIWLGTTIEHQATTYRADILRDIDAAVRFVSAEPLLGSMTLDLTGIHWLISGGESGHHLMREHVCAERGLVVRRTSGDGPLWAVREDRADWVRTLRDQCLAAGTAFWHKQWGGSSGHLAGRDLDGRTWDEMPTVEGAMPAAGYVHRERLKHQLPLLA